MFQSHLRHSRGFTLVELLIVITIIAILAGLLGSVAYVALSRAQQTKISVEISGIEKGLELFKAAYGDYPPDCGNLTNNDVNVANLARARFARFMTTKFPRMPKVERDEMFASLDPNNAQSNIQQLYQLDPAEAIVFWLSLTHDNKQYPLTNNQYSFAQNGPNGSNPLITERDNQKKFYDFKDDQLSDVDLDGWPEYHPSGADQIAPFIYFNAETYILTTDNNGWVVGSYYSLQGNYGVAVPYLASTGAVPNSATMTNTGNPPKFANPEKFQIVCAGMDGKYSTRMAVPDPNNTVFTAMRADQYATNLLYPWFPSGENYTLLTERDNITNFSEGSALEDKMEQ